MNKEIQQKVESCKALQGMSVADIIATARFRDNLAAYMTAQREMRKMAQSSYQAMHKLGGPKKYKLPAHPIDRLMELTVGEFAQEYAAVISRTSRRPFAERQYIEQLGRQAYSLTVAQYVVEEFPELENELIPKSNNS